jgi:glycogen(starch) synthase
MPDSARPTLLMTADTIGGVWTYALELSHALAQHGWRVVLATMGEPLSPGQRADLQGIAGLELCESTYRLEWMPEPWSDVDAAAPWLLGLEQRFRPSVIHLNGYTHGALPWRAPVLMVGHSCVLSWWQAVKGENAPEAWGDYHFRVRAGLQNARMIVAPTHAMLQALHEHYGPLPTSRVIYNGRSAFEMNPGGDPEGFVFAAGRLGDEAKNIAALGKAAKGLSWPVYVAGAASDASGSCALPANVHVCGKLTPAEVHAWMARASIYCLPARYEPFGLSILEAALDGCALVLGDIASLRELWEDCALFVPPDDPVAIRTAIQHLIDHPQERQELAKLGRERATTFSHERFVREYLSAYSELIDQQRPRSIAA